MLARNGQLHNCLKESVFVLLISDVTSPNNCPIACRRWYLTSTNNTSFSVDKIIIIIIIMTMVQIHFLDLL